MDIKLLHGPQTMIDMASESEEGHFEQILFDGRTVVVTDYGETLLLKDFRLTTAIWTEEYISFERLRELLNESDEALIDRC